MNPFQAYVFDIAVLLLAAIALILLVRKPLHAILLELCGAEHRASFWERLYDAAVILGVLFFSFWAPPLPEPGSATVAFEGLSVGARGKSNKLLAHIEDVDGFDDLVVQIEDDDRVFDAGDTTALLTGLMYDGTPFQGTGSICIVP